MKISACYIVKNEAANIARSIESLDGAADEIIVVDTGSTDDTVAVCEKLGARIERFEWTGDFAAARNYAISLASGSAIIFLDADEWFEPKLGAAGREYITKNFAGGKLDCLTIVIRNVDRVTGRVMDTSIVNRVFANKPSIRYQGKVHEHLHGVESVVTTADIAINHSGYSKDLMKEKLVRNIDLLENAYAASGEGSMNQVRFLTYLVRECHHAGRLDDSAKYLRLILQHPGALRKLCAFHNEEFVGGIYFAILVAYKKRAAVSRLDVRKKLFGIFKEAYPIYPGTAESELLYHALFDVKEDKILEKVSGALAAARTLHKPETVAYYKEYEKFIVEKAAMAAWRRGDRMKALDLSVAALKSGAKKQGGEALLVILLNALKGQNPEEIILLLNSIYDAADKDELDTLIKQTRIDGMGIVYAYYAKKQMDTGAIRTDDYVTMLLVGGKHDAALAAAAQSAESGNPNAALYAFISIVCGASAEAAQSCAELIKDYKRVLDAYSEDRPLENVDERDAQILRSAYPVIALAIGIEAAEKFLNVYKNAHVLRFSIKSAYCEVSGRFDMLVDETMDGILETDIYHRSYFISANVLNNRFDAALGEIKKLLAQKIIDLNLLQQLLVIAEKEGGGVGAEARSLYNDYMEMFDLAIDLRDVANTGVIVDDDKILSRQALKIMSAEEFERMVAEEAKRPSCKDLVAQIRAALNVYISQKRAPEAVRCLVKLLAHNEATDAERETLAQQFIALKNKAIKIA